MNTQIYYGLNILVLAALVLIVGLIKPKWIFLWMDKPGRMPVAMVAAVLFMIGMVLFGEGNKAIQKEKASTAAKPTSENVSTEVPVPAKGLTENKP